MHDSTSVPKFRTRLYSNKAGHAVDPVGAPNPPLLSLEVCFYYTMLTRYGEEWTEPPLSINTHYKDYELNPTAVHA